MRELRSLTVFLRDDFLANEVETSLGESSDLPLLVSSQDKFEKLESVQAVDLTGAASRVKV